MLEHLQALLAPEERLRAGQFDFATDRDRFIACRAILRQLLGVYLGRSPGELILESGPHGKPVLRSKAGHWWMRFNLSHAHNVALYAFARGRELGIDLERIQPEFPGHEVAEHFFSAGELSELRGLPAEVWAHGFFSCWTSKEAYLKACGYGLTLPLNSFDTSSVPGRAKELQSADHRKWKLYRFEPAPGFVAAVVGEGVGWRVRHFDLAAPFLTSLVGLAAAGQTTRPSVESGGANVERHSPIFSNSSSQGHS